MKETKCSTKMNMQRISDEDNNNEDDNDDNDEYIKDEAGDRRR